MGGMGGMGMRSVPPTGAPFATLRPEQTRELSTSFVSLNPPIMRDRVLIPDKGEELVLGDIRAKSDNPRLQAALKRLAEEKAPVTVAQLVIWRVGFNLDWNTIGRISTARKWSNASELALAKAFVARLDAARGALADGESARVYWDVTASGADNESIAADIRNILKEKVVVKDEKGNVVKEYDATVLGLVPKLGIPAKTDGPALSIKVRLTGTEATVQLATTDGATWQPAGKFTLPLTKADGGRLKFYEVADQVAEGTVTRLIRVQLTRERGRDRQGREIYKMRIDNSSPLILNGLVLAGPKVDAEHMPTGLAGFSLPPRKSLTVPTTAEAVGRLGLTDGVKVLAADLSGL